MKVLKALAAGTNAKLYLYAGSHLGVNLHGWLNPWEDDFYVIIDIRKKSAVWEGCIGKCAAVHSSGKDFNDPNIGMPSR